MNRKNLLQRAVVVIWGVPLALTCAYVGGWLFTAMIVFLGTLAIWELTQMLRQTEMAPFRVISLLAGILFPVLAHLGHLSYLAAGMYGFVLIAGMTALAKPAEEGFKRLMATLFASIYVGFSFSSAVLIRDDAAWEDSLTGAVIIGFVWVGVWITDIMAYLIGNLAGRHRLAPKLSPGKTVEGFLGGLVFALLWSYFAGMLLGDLLTPLDRIVLGVIFGAVSTVGDLLESMFKRSSGLKDSGSFFPGHGGVFDRFDSLIFVQPAVYLYLLLAGVLAI